MNLQDIQKLNLPKSPGVYQFLDKAGRIIYIGKASNLKNRISSYWQKSANHSSAKHSMLKQVAKIKIIKTDSEIEALLLEANLIKKNQPKYNVVLRDDKRYVYIKISTEEEWPRVFVTRKLEKQGKYFGPFVSMESVREALKTIRKIWPFRSCRNIPQKTCLYYRIGKCPGMCEKLISKKDYNKIIKQIILFLEGRKKELVKKIKKEIKLAENYKEDVDYLKYQLLNLEKVLAHTNILSLQDKYASDVVELAKVLGLPKIPKRIEGYDVSNIFGQEAVGSMVVFQDGEPNKNEYRKFKISSFARTAKDKKFSDVQMLKEVLERRFKNDWPKSDLIIIDGGKAQLNTAVRVLKKFDLNIPVISVSKGAGLRSAQAPDKIFFPDQKNPLELPLVSPALHLVKRVRDEAHRFAIIYHRKLKKKKIFK